MDLVDEALEYNSQNANYESDLFKPRISVFGVGGGGSNTVNRIAKIGVRGANLIALNTDNKHLKTLDTSIKRILIGAQLTRGLGAGGFPDIGAKCAQYSKMDIENEIKDSNLIFIAAGMGGGTGSGAAPVVAEIAKELGAVVVSIVTFPFALERIRIETAKKAINELKKNSDTLIIIDNQRLVTMYPNLQLDQAFKVADEVTSHAVIGISETIATPSLINLDFADFRSIMKNSGLAMISVGEGSGQNKVEDVIKSTLNNKLLDVNYEGVKGILLNVIGGEDLTLGEANEIATGITASASPNAEVIWGARIDPRYNQKVEVVAIFTGVKSPSILGISDDEDQKSSVDRFGF